MYDHDKPANQAMEISARSETMMQRYQRRLTDAREEVSRLEKLNALLESNPETAQILTLMGIH